jgi:hypothetical protein
LAGDLKGEYFHIADDGASLFEDFPVGKRADRHFADLLLSDTHDFPGIKCHEVIQGDWSADSEMVLLWHPAAEDAFSAKRPRVVSATQLPDRAACTALVRKAR